jgi:hypothetical protein
MDGAIVNIFNFQSVLGIGTTGDNAEVDSVFVEHLLGPFLTERS